MNPNNTVCSFKLQALKALIISGLSIAIFLNTLFLLPTVAQSMPMKDQIIEMVMRQAKAWSEQDAQAIADDFAEDGIFIAAESKFQVKPHIKQAAEEYFQQFHHTSVEIKRIIFDGIQAAVEWNWHEQNRQTGKEGNAEDAIILELKNNKIVYWREYIEKKKQR